MKSRKPTRAYWSAYAALYGVNGATENPIKPRAKPRRLEELEQEKFNVWFERNLAAQDIRWFHPANGGRVGIQQGAKFKRLGVKAGVPDIIVPVSRSSYHGLVIELKRVDGKESDLSAEQRDWLDWFRGQQWAAHVAFGFEHAKTIVENYLDKRML